MLPSGPSDCCSPAGKTPEEVLKKYLQKVRHPPDEVRAAGVMLGCAWGALLWEERLGTQAMPPCCAGVSHCPSWLCPVPVPLQRGAVCYMHVLASPCGGPG